jgi:hypothetical protein
MRTYALTVYDENGENLLNESFEAENDEKAKELGQKRLEEENYENHTHRCVTPEAKLILFHR